MKPIEDVMTAATAGLVLVPVSLSTPAARRFLRRNVAPLAPLSRRPERSARRRRANRARLDQVLDHLSAHLAEARGLLEERGSRLRAWTQSHGRAPVHVDTSSLRPARAAIDGPSHSLANDAATGRLPDRYLALLKTADDTFIEIEKAWLLGMLPDVERARLQQECRCTVRRIHDLIRRRRAEWVLE